MKSLLWLRFILLIIILLVGSLGCAARNANVPALKMLVRLSKDNKLKQKALEQETKNFRSLKNYINSNKIESGISTKYAVKHFGEPVLIFTESNNKERWAYKPHDANWIGGEKIYLYFDEKGSLLNWECVNCR